MFDYNGGPHKRKDIRTTIEDNGNYLQYSVPYRPKTNAIESWFNQFKYYYKINDDSTTFNQLKTKVKKSIKKINKQSYENYMKYAYKNKEIRKFELKNSTRIKSLKKL